MKRIKRMTPVLYIKFDNGGEIKYERLCEELDEMEDADSTIFNMCDKVDKALYELIKSRCTGNEISHETAYTATKIRVFWNDNENLILALENEIRNIAYPGEE